MILRKEIKYRISLSEAYSLQQKLEKIMDADPHNGAEGYKIRSLYFDSLNDAALKEVLDGVEEKRKLRLRIYNAEIEKVKLEYKCKSDTNGIKKVIKLNAEQAAKMMGGDYGFLEEMDSDLARKIYLRLLSGFYLPRSIVEYRRHAYFYEVGDTRVTLDTEIKGTTMVDSFLEEEIFTFPLLPLDVVVLELKYNDFLPCFIKNLTKEIDRLPRANSKYVLSRLI